ncbi:serine hydrolase [Secundilactobacillus paracollinoides]|uniref:Serine hydrolase n=1 Tax=Secundilactobacillus paracollinoides TaxID=240427 RepID=A0A1B2IZR5_9LACO|nr:serine hydrolase domain-containing protein [Secundilactobacillus paracollinoides]ANZ63303.1 serine hydrolase [Secundilactobacillus paracollinoides]ANZ67584.1 serine hydrolase [Secundilactobacillus paracollinoides]KRL76021.1 Beta-lactamase class C related penicillin binding protein [Secundilactobacillus paracollinoides DSM 15502 = JCM 11969]
MATYSKTIRDMHALVEEGVVPGISYAFIDDNTVQSGIYGAEQLLPGYEPLKENQYYDLASLTKVVGTVNVILQLVDEGRLALTDKVHGYLPEWTDTTVSVRHLITHTSGIAGYIPNRNKLPASQLHDALLNLHVGPDFEQKMVYSDINFIFLGWIAEAITGTPIQQLIAQRVLEPLKMAHSTFSPTDAAMCVPTELSPTRGLIRGVVHDPKAFVLRERCGSAGLFATRDDLVTFEQAILSGHNSPLPDQFRQQIAKDQTPLGHQGRSFGWALLPVNDAHPHQCIWHSGYTGTAIVLDLVTNQGLVFLSNRVHPDAPNKPFLARRNAVIATYLEEK